MREERRRERNEALREWIDRGARCPFCGSLHLDVDATFESPQLEPQRHEAQITSNKPYEFKRVNCSTCGYVLFFNPSEFGPPSR